MRALIVLCAAMVAPAVSAVPAGAATVSVEIVASTG